MGPRVSRDQALRLVLDIKLPDDWDPTFHAPHDFTRVVFRWPPGVTAGQGKDATGMVTLDALSRSRAGLVEVHGGGYTVRCDARAVQAAFDHVLAWINR